MIYLFYNQMRKCDKETVQKKFKRPWDKTASGKPYWYALTELVPRGTIIGRGTNLGNLEKRVRQGEFL